MLRKSCSALLLVLLVAAAAQAQAPYVGASEADNEFWRITAGDMNIIKTKKVLYCSRSYGENMLGGLSQLAAKNAMYTIDYVTRVVDLNFNRDLTLMPVDIFSQHKLPAYLCNVSYTTRVDDFDWYVRTAPYVFGNQADTGMIEFHQADPSAFANYSAKGAAMRRDYPNFKFVFLTAGVQPPGPYQSADEASWQFGQSVLDTYKGVAPVLDWRSLLSTHEDGTSAGHMMCPEFNYSDQLHPNRPFIQDRLGKAYLMMMYKLFCNPGLAANAGFDRIYYDNDRNGSETVVLDGSASVDVRNNRPIVRYQWYEGSTVLADTASSTVSLSLALGVHTIELTVTNNATPPETSTDEVVITVASPKVLIADAGPDLDVLDVDPYYVGFETVSLDGSRSASTIGRNIVSYVWKDAGRVIGTTVTIAPNNFCVGIHDITLTVTDDAVPPNTDTDTMTINLSEQTVRVSDGLQALYLFKDASGTTVRDVSGVGTPLNLTIASSGAVSWIPAGGLTVNSPVLIASPGPATKLLNPCQTQGEVTLEAWIKPASAVQSGLANILTMSGDQSHRNFTLAQGLSNPATAAVRYSARLRASGTTLDGEPAIASADGTATTNLQHVVYTRQGAQAATLYINGSVAATGIHEGVFFDWDASYRLGLADEVGGGRPWLGTYYLAAVYSRALTADEVNRNYQATSAPATPGCPKVLGWQSLATRGNLAPELQWVQDTTYVNTRINGLNTMTVTFSRPVLATTAIPANVTITGTRSGNLSPRISSVSLDATGRVMTICCSSLPAADKIRFQLSTNIKDQWGQSIQQLYLGMTYADLFVTVSSLVGDVDKSGKVTATDLLAARAHVGQAATGSNAVYDVDGSGTITGLDLLAIQGCLGNTLP